MKIRTPNCECIVCEDNGRVVLRAVDSRGTYFAIKRMRQFVDAYLEESKTRDTTKTTPP